MTNEQPSENPAKVLYTARTRTTGGRDGMACSSDGRLDIRLSSPGSMGEGTNPEQLFAAGWSACFEGASAAVARQMKIQSPPDMAIDAEVDLCTSDGAYYLRARLNISLPGLDPETARRLIDAVHQICPYSKAVRNNIDVEINLI